MEDLNTDVDNTSDYPSNTYLDNISEFLTFFILSLLITNLILSYTNCKIDENMDIVNNIIAPLIVGIITAGFGWLWALRKIKQRIEAAPKRYVNELDKLIFKALNEGKQKAVINARAIVSTRNSLRNSLVELSKHLNSEIDRLAQEIGETVETPLPPSKLQMMPESIDAEKAYDTIIVLSKIWPSKKIQVEYEIRKLLTDLGIK